MFEQHTKYEPNSDIEIQRWEASRFRRITLPIQYNDSVLAVVIPINTIPW